jgi:UDP-glucose 4-epimerase
MLSSADVYGNGKLPLTEEHATQPLSAKATELLEIENQVRLFSRSYKIPHVILRAFSTYGPEEPMQEADSSVTGNIKYYLHQGLPVSINGDGLQTRDFVHVDDVVEALLLAEQNVYLKDDTINVGSGKSFPIKALISSLGSSTSPGKPLFSDIHHTLASTCKMKLKLGLKLKHSFLNEIFGILKNTTLDLFSDTQKWLKNFQMEEVPWLLSEKFVF